MAVEVAHTGRLEAAVDAMMQAHEITPETGYGSLSGRWLKERGVCIHCLSDIAERTVAPARELYEDESMNLDRVMRDCYVSGFTAALALVRP